MFYSTLHHSVSLTQSIIRFHFEMWFSSRLILINIIQWYTIDTRAANECKVQEEKRKKEKGKENQQKNEEERESSNESLLFLEE